MAFCSYFKIQPVAGGADRIKKSEWKLVSHDNSQPPPRAGTAAFYRFRLFLLPRPAAGSPARPLACPDYISPPLPRPPVHPSSRRPSRSSSRPCSRSPPSLGCRVFRPLFPVTFLRPIYLSLGFHGIAAQPASSTALNTPAVIGQAAGI